MELASILQAIIDDIAEETANRVIAKMGTATGQRSTAPQTVAAPAEAAVMPAKPKAQPKFKPAQKPAQQEEYQPQEETVIGADTPEEDDTTPEEYLITIVNKIGQDKALAMLKEAGGERLSLLDDQQTASFVAAAKKVLGA